MLESEQEESELKHLSIKTFENVQVTVVKTFNVPVDFPFDVSDNNFENWGRCVPMIHCCE